MAESIQKMGILDKVEVEVRIGMEMASLVVCWECFGHVCGSSMRGEGRVGGGEQRVVIGLGLHGYMGREQIIGRVSKMANSVASIPSPLSLPFHHLSFHLSLSLSLPDSSFSPLPILSSHLPHLNFVNSPSQLSHLRLFKQSFEAVHACISATGVSRHSIPSISLCFAKKKAKNAARCKIKVSFARSSPKVLSLYSMQ